MNESDLSCFIYKLNIVCSSTIEKLDEFDKVFDKLNQHVNKKLSLKTSGFQCLPEQ